MRKYKQFQKRYKNNFINIYFGFEIFNPIGYRPTGEIIPIFELIPRIGIGINRETSYLFTIGWLNISFSINILKFKICKYKN